MDSNPSRAKRRISSNPCQGFISRFKRSAFCALVSLAGFVIKLWSEMSGKIKNPPPGSSGDGFMSAGVKKNFLGQQPPRASAHACTTTTSATAHRAKIAAL
jgi:hypothetical protein